MKLPNLSFQTKQNNRIIEDLVSEYFSLCPDSIQKFAYYLEKPLSRSTLDFEKVYNSPDLRLRYELSCNELSNLDEQWFNFKKKFKTFCKQYNVKYFEFSSGLVTINKNQVKLQKALFDFYTNINNVSFLIKDFQSLYFIKRRVYNSDDYYLSLHYDDFSNYSKRIKSPITIKKYIEEKKVSFFYNTVEWIQKNISRTLYNYSDKKIPFSPSSKKKYEIVISANYADWFLCSTGESWKTCTSLESTYSQSYWIGQPSYITDKNRLLIYITDGVKKNYKGIITDRFLSRSWLMLVYNKKEKNIFINKGYPKPHHEIFDFFIKKTFGKNFKTFFGNYNDTAGIKYISVYPIPFLWHDVSYIGNRGFFGIDKVECSSYIDNGHKILSDNDSYFITNSTTIDETVSGGVNNFYCTKSKGIISTKESRFVRFNYDLGFSCLVEDERIVTDFIHND